MEAKFFKEIEEKMDVKILKDFEKEIRTKINHELEVERKTNEDLARILLVGESQQFFFLNYGIIAEWGLLVGLS